MGAKIVPVDTTVNAIATPPVTMIGVVFEVSVDSGIMTVCELAGVIWA